MKREKIRKIRKLAKYSVSPKVSSILILEIVFGAMLSVLSLIIFLKIGREVLEHDVLRFDTAVTQVIYGIRSPGMTQIMKLLSFLGRPLFLIPASLLFILYLFTKRRKDVLIYSSIFYTGIILNIILKAVFQRPRPLNLPLIHENSYSFPSGHAMNSFVFYMALSYFVFRETGNLKRSILIGTFSVALVLLIGISRVYLGVHFPSDVVAGYIAGFLWFISVILFEKTIIYRRMYRFSKK